MNLSRLIRILVIALGIARRDPNEPWFQSPAWQQHEDDASSDLAEGRFEDFRSINALIATLRAPASETAADPIAVALRRVPRNGRDKRRS